MEDGLYEKYRVFREPELSYNHGHPVPLFGPHFVPDETGDPIELEEVQSFLFVLKPDSDPHARVALAAYAESVHNEKPHLAADLWATLNEMRD